jgi:NADPH:quinone reductase-like Zn-dependent oxidoreductase
MKAFAIDQFGEPGTIRDMEVPEPGPGEVRIRVAAAGANPVDNAILQGYMKDMMEHRFPLVPGIDAAGTIDALGEGVTRWKEGDSVFGSSGKPYFGGGTFAEYATLSEGTVAPVPASLEPSQVAAIPVAGVTALMVLDALEAGQGDVVLAIGAVGGVGSYFVQLAAGRGARVIAVCRSENGDYVRALGAEDVIDYTLEDVGEALASRYEQGVNAIADLIGNKEELSSAIAHSKIGARVASCVGAVDEAELAQRDLVGQNVSGVVTTERLEYLASERSSGRLQDPAIEALTLDDASEALDRLAGRHVRGKLVLKP